MKNKTIILDGSNLLHRSYWVSSVRRNVSVEQLFINSIKKLGEQFKFKEYICVWDSRQVRGVKNYRRSTDKQYKQNRDKGKNTKVFSHEPACIELIECLGIKNLNPGMLEADDFIAWLTRNDQIQDSVVVSSDGDLLQLVSDRCCVYNPIKDLIISEDNFEDVTSVKNVRDFIAFKAIVGDKSDNIEGVSGVGPKRALSLINDGLKNVPKAAAQIIEHNMDLIDLDCGLVHHPEEADIYDETYNRVTANTKVDMQQFTKLCKTHGLQQTLKNIPAYERCFDHSKSTEAVVTNLIKLLE